ncbi:hypothetical protein BRARA_A03010 [Brassica rapa]|uniref:Uncharacterized protein n=1 Tax=Brassica campestris TaxID=3711 RepID=A0A398ARI0_BRACM|nr:hypothetical protein BRARA_A03010 [Brassica rapa]
MHEPEVISAISVKETKALVYQLCSTPSKLYKHVYIASLNSDLKTFTLDLHGLVGMVIQKTSLGYKNLKMTKGLARTTTDPNLQIPYRSCATGYDEAMHEGQTMPVYVYPRNLMFEKMCNIE